ncbi:RNA-directed DNA polymerase from mobile element jockey [Pitangus sulphuratus]|nr:RNA-directed DNA polymerase from mobile element jockey [Pitangus sulphuratus]
MSCQLFQENSAGDGVKGFAEVQVDYIHSLPLIHQDLLLQLDPYNSGGPEGIHVRILKDLAVVIAKPLLMISEQCWESEEVPSDWKLANVLIFRRASSRTLETTGLSLSLVPGKVMEKIILGSIEKHVKDNAVMGHSRASQENSPAYPT